MFSKPPTSTATSIKHDLLVTNVVGSKLSSLTPARDLTLGGRGSGNANAKKVFIPNLNAVRNKNANVKTSKDTTTRGRGRGRGKAERGGGRGATRGGGTNAALIQTSGVFSEGAGAVNVRKGAFGSSSSSSNTRNDDAISAMRKPTLIKTLTSKSDLKADEAHVREILGDSEDDDLENEKTDLAQKPIKLSDVKWKLSKSTVKLEKFDMNGADDENDCEIVDDGVCSTFAMPQKEQPLKQKHMQENQRMLDTLPTYPKNLTDLLESTKSQILVIQLPDTLPCEDECTNATEPPTEGKMSNTTEASATTNSPAPKSVSKSSTFKQMDEGQVGKIMRYKSGKVKLLLGECYFDLNIGMETGFLQDLMSISANREERSGNMINLGPIQAKLTATPDWEQLLQ